MSSASARLFSWEYATRSNMVAYSFTTRSISAFVRTSFTPLTYNTTKEGVSLQAWENLQARRVFL